MSSKTPFEILYDRYASVDDLAQAYVAFENLQKNIEAKHHNSKEKCIRLKQRLMNGESCKEDYNKARAKLDDVSIELDAIQDAMQTMFAVLVNRMPIETQNKIDDLSAKVKSLKARKEDQLHEFLTLAARAAAYRERIFGRQKSVIQMSDGPKCFDAFPAVGVRPSAQRGWLDRLGLGRNCVFVDGDLEAFYIKAVGTARHEFGIDDEDFETPLNDQIERLTRERFEIEKNQIKKVDLKVAVAERLDQERTKGRQVNTRHEDTPAVD